MSRNTIFLYSLPAQDLLIQLDAVLDSMFSPSAIPNLQKLIYISSLAPQLSDLKNLSVQHYNHQQSFLLLGTSNSLVIWDASTEFSLISLAQVVGSLTQDSLLLILLSASANLNPTNNIAQKKSNLQDYVLETARLFNFTTLSFPAQKEQLSQYLVTKLAQLCSSSLSNQPDIILSADQAQAFNLLINSSARTFCLIAKRGRGKTTLLAHYAAQFLAPASIHTYICSKHKKATFAVPKSPTLEFIAPDLLVKQCLQGEDFSQRTLIVDEASQLNINWLFIFYKANFKRIIFSTTIESYEGTSLGFIYNFLKYIEYQVLHLDTCLRWHPDDPLELFLDTLLSNNFDYQQHLEFIKSEKTLIPLNKTKILYKQDNFSRSDFQQMFYLLRLTHYKTKVSDLTRLLDSQNNFFVGAYYQQKLLALLWYIKENTSYDLALRTAIVQGQRMPAGNLVLQRLACLLADPEILLYNNLRISRISVMDNYRQQGLSLDLLQQPLPTEDFDFLSVSYLQDPYLDSYWQKRGFVFVHQSHNKKSFGNAGSCIAIKPISERGQLILSALNEQNRLNRECYNFIQDNFVYDLNQLHSEAELKLLISKIKASIEKLSQETSQENITANALAFSLPDCFNLTSLDQKLLVNYAVQLAFHFARYSLLRLYLKDIL